MTDWTRRQWLWLAGASGALAVSGCAGGQTRAETSFWLPDEKSLVFKAARVFEIVERKKPNAGVLRRRAREVPAGMDLSSVAAMMEKSMNKAEGVGIAGPQVGLGLRITTLMLDYKTDHPHTVFIRNPVIVERSDETAEGYEGCLSVPGVGGLVRRNLWIKIEHQRADGQIERTEAEGANAVLWQHELDHLDGVLYLDRLIGKLLPMEEVRRIRKELEQQNQDISRGPVSLPLEGSLGRLA